jgi:thiamine biosynthesis lipoprotein
VLVNSHSAVLAKTSADAARKEIARLDDVFNHRRSDSELSTLNQSRFANASVDLFAVVQAGELWRQITRGAFDGRMGALLRLWSAATPQAQGIAGALAALRASTITLSPERQIELSSGVILSLDAIAKGYIVDAALNAARRAAPTIAGIAIGIGGDIRCWGESPDCRGWRIGIPDATMPVENAPLVDAVMVKNAAIATSGRGPRDFVGKQARSATLSPFTGHPVSEVISVSAVASHTADADAIATACMVLCPKDSLALINQLDGVAVRITDAHGQVHQSSGWPAIRLAATSPQQPAPTAKPPSLPPALRWPDDWELGINYVAPDRQESRSADFRTPFMALWITDAQGRPVRTLFMIGKSAEWQRDNFIWWGLHRQRAKQLVELRSQSTSMSGRYPVYWPGVDDDWQSVPLGKYTLHVETSQERGKHSYRSIPIELGHQRFKAQLPNLPDSGGIEITYGHYNDRFNSDD